MATHVYTTPGADVRSELIDLTTDADAPLMRLCALLGRLQSLTAELESITASLPARTAMGRRMKELTL